MIKAKITQMENGMIGVIIPQSVLEDLGACIGDEVSIAKAESAEEQIKVGHKFMKKYDTTLTRLSEL